MSTASSLPLAAVLSPADARPARALAVAAAPVAPVDPAAQDLELLREILSAHDFAEACGRVADALAARWRARWVAIGTVAMSTVDAAGAAARVEAVSGSATLDRGSPWIAALAARMTAQGDSGDTLRATEWSPSQLSAGRAAELAQARRVELTPTSAARPIVALVADESPAGVVDLNHPQERRLLQLAGLCLDRMRPAPSWSARARAWLATGGVSRRRWLGALAAVLAFALLVPVPCGVSCPCEVQPATRRFVVAPFEGRLLAALVRPGDAVEAGQLLARFDDVAVRLELDAVEAELERASRSHDANLAGGKTSAAQLDRAEINRQTARRDLLRRRLEQLELRSPTAGTVVAGDLSRTVGAPLEQGQVLFEIAPLDQVVVELAVPERRVRHVKSGQQVSLGLASQGGRRWHGAVERVHPRAELRDQRNVFVAEVALPNTDGQMRPGARGWATVWVAWRPWAWQWTEDAWDTLVGWFS